MSNTTYMKDPENPDYTFSCCVVCGGELSSRTEKFDGLCYFCDDAAPLPMEVTEAGHVANCVATAEAYVQKHGRYPYIPAQ